MKTVLIAVGLLAAGALSAQIPSLSTLRCGEDHTHVAPEHIQWFERLRDIPKMLEIVAADWVEGFENWPMIVEGYENRDPAAYTAREIGILEAKDWASEHCANALTQAVSEDGKPDEVFLVALRLKPRWGENP